MSNYKAIKQDGGKGYKPPYPGHEAMCVVKQSMVSGAKGGGLASGKKVTEGKQSTLANGTRGRSSANGDRGRQAAKVKHK